MPASACRDDEGVRRFLNPQDGCWHIQITQGETYVTSASDEILTTVLGSCIAACIRDPGLGVGGMNHFLLASGKGAASDATRYGINAMEVLINEILKRGGVRSRLEAKLFGGANVIAGLSGIGSSNAAFAEKYLADEGIALVGGDVRGSAARRIQYWPVSGRARQLAAPDVSKVQLAQREQRAAEENARRAEQELHDVELF